MAAKLLTYVCGDCGRPLGVMPAAPYRCPRTRRMVQPHTPAQPRRTPMTPAVRELRERRELLQLDIARRNRTRRARRARLTVTVEWPTGA